jgi:hypothetical protein
MGDVAEAAPITAELSLCLQIPWRKGLPVRLLDLLSNARWCILGRSSAIERGGRMDPLTSGAVVAAVRQHVR